MDKLQIEYEKVLQKLHQAEDKGPITENELKKLKTAHAKIEKRFTDAIAHLEKGQEMMAKFEDRKELFSKPAPAHAAPAQSSWINQGANKKAEEQKENKKADEQKADNTIGTKNAGSSKF